MPSPLHIEARRVQREDSGEVAVRADGECGRGARRAPGHGVRGAPPLLNAVNEGGQSGGRG